MRNKRLQINDCVYKRTMGQIEHSAQAQVRDRVWEQGTNQVWLYAQEMTHDRVDYEIGFQVLARIEDRANKNRPL